MAEIPEHILIKLREREEFRNKKNWYRADKLRDEILKMGFKITDNPDEFILEENHDATRK